MLRTLLLSTAAPLCLLAAAGHAAAQTTATGGSPSQASGQAASASRSSAAATGTPTAPSGVTAGPAGGLGEVIVTAQRRTENLQKAAVAVDVVSGSSLVANEITDEQSLSFLVPGLTVEGTSFFLRGVGNFTNTPYSDPALAFNYDSVYIGRPSATSGPFYDLERVEVLKGPQGTLYGINATGGAINVVPTKPQLNHLGGYLITSVGNYGAYDVEGAVNAPLGDATAVRLSVNFLGHDGYLSDGTSDQDSKAFRAQILSKPIADLSVRLSVDYADVGGLGQGSNLQGAADYNRKTGTYVFVGSDLSRETGLYSPATSAVLEHIPAGPSGRAFGPLLGAPYDNTKLWGTNAEINYTTPAGTVTLIPAARSSVLDSGTGVPAFVADLTEDDQEFSTELRFAGRRVGIFDYTLGALFYYENDKGAYAIDQEFQAVFQNYSQHTQEAAGFFRATAHVTDRLRLVGGIRYTDDQKNFDGDSVRLTVACAVTVAGAPTCPKAPLFPLVPSLSQETLPVPGPNGVRPIPGTGAVVARGDTAVDAPLDNGKATYHASLEYDLAPRSLAYISYDTGFRAGGFSLANGYTTYEPEYLDAYSIGVKNRLFEDRLELNGEIYYWKYRNQQVSHLGVDLSGQTASFTQNVGSSTIQGAEIEGRFLLTPKTILTSNVQYLSAIDNSFLFQEPISGGAPPLTGCKLTPDATNTALDNVNCSGKASFNSPKWTLDFGIQHTIPVGSFWLQGVADTQYQSSRYVGFDYIQPEFQTPTWQTNMELVLSPKDGPWSLAVFVRNLEDDRFATSASSFTSLISLTTAPPRTYGIRASVKY